MNQIMLDLLYLSKVTMSILATPFPVYQPAMRIIASISNAFPAVVTTTFNHQYKTGTIVRLNIPLGYGMYQANGLIGTITAISGLNFTLNIDSSGFDAFVVPSGNVEQPASIAPYGSRNVQYTNGTSEFVPFQSLNNIGN